MAKKLKKERWAFSASELKSPENLNSWDELIAYPYGLDFGVIVYRNGIVSNHYDDGTAGVLEEERELASDEEILFHPEYEEETAEWKNVFVDDDGNFIRFA